MRRLEPGEVLLLRLVVLLVVDAAEAHEGGAFRRRLVQRKPAEAAEADPIVECFRELYIREIVPD